jgi:hypothetical protein
MRLFLMPLAAALVLACGLAHAQAYRWVEKDGKVRYGDVPPPGVKATPLKAPAAGSAPPVPAAAKDGAAKDPAAKDAKKGPLTPAEQEQAYRDRQLKAKEAQDKQDKERLAADQRKQNCTQAQESLRTMEAGRRLSSVNAKGETVFLDDAQVQERIAQARKVVAESCT